MKRKTKVQLSTWATWAAGAVILYLLWNTRVFVSETVESLFGFILFLVAFFYFLAYGSIKDYFERNISDE